jgi:Tol biopolymer transport system component/DNA-binding winged helix-turn-helix (wHTH) protein
MTARTQPTGGAIRVGDFVVDPSSGELRGGDAGRQTLSAQPLQVLLALAERPGILVTRDELRGRLWPADTFVDFEHGLNAVVKRLRDALGDSADTPRYIETVPRRGYRLIAAVHANDEAAQPRDDSSPLASAPPVADPAGPAPSSPGRRRMVLAGAAIAIGVLAAGGLLYQARWRVGEVRAGASPPQPDPAPTRVTFGPGLQTDVTWSPDGGRIAFAWDRDGNFDIFTQRVDGGEPTRITSSPANDTQPAWSPDGRILVFRSEEDGGGLFTVGINGGPIRRITSMGFRPAWMPNGLDVAFVDERDLQAVYLVRAGGGEPPRAILERELAGGNWRSFAVHPDGRITVLGVHRASPLGFYVTDRAYGRLQRVPTEVAVPPEWANSLTRAFWSPAGDAVFVESWSAGVIAIWRTSVDRATLTLGRPVRLPIGPASAGRAGVSPDGTRVAFTTAQSSTRAWAFPFDADHRAPPGEGRALTDDDASIYGLDISADGSAIYYAEDRPGRDGSRALRTDLRTGATTVLAEDVFSGIAPSSSGHGVSYLLSRKVPGTVAGVEYALAWRDASGRERLLSAWGEGAVVPDHWRRDDAAVLGTFLERAFTGPAALVEWPVGPSAAAGPSRVLLASMERQFWQGRYSPDGRWVSFVAHRLSGDNSQELGIAPVRDHAAPAWTRLAADHAWPDKPRWSPDSRTLYFLSPALNGFYNLWGIRLDPARGVPVGKPFQVTHFDSPRWHVDPNMPLANIGIAKGWLALPMRTVKGSIWVLGNVAPRSAASGPAISPMRSSR